MAITVRSLLSLASRVLRAGSSSPPEAPRRGGARKNTRAARLRKSVLDYSPSTDGDPDPGEIVWTWVPYEDDPSQGKDRPVLLIGSDSGMLLGLMLTSRDRNNARDHDDRYVDVGTGAWDRQGRPSEVKVDRILRIAPADIRREGAVLPRRRFDQVVAAIPGHLLG